VLRSGKTVAIRLSVRCLCAPRDGTTLHDLLLTAHGSTSVRLIETSRIH
jgi:hypothetical protein